MRLDPAVLARVTVAFNLENYVRITPLAYRTTPLGCGYGETRFASPTKSFRILYLGFNLATSVAETIVRDRFEGLVPRELVAGDVDKLGAVEISAKDPLGLIDVRTDGPLRLGVSTDVKNAKDHTQGRTFSQSIHDESTADGILYFSRLTGESCCAVYERAVGKLVPGPVVELLTLAGLVPALASLGIKLA